MVCRVKYYHEDINAYAGASYTYISDLPLTELDKVIAPTYKGDAKAIVVEVDLPAEAISPAWADRVQTITEYDR